MVVCTRCFQRNEVEGDDLTIGQEPIGWNLLSENAAENGYAKSHNTTSEQSSRSVAEQQGHADGSKESTPQIEAPFIAPLRFSASLDEPLADPLNWTTEHSSGSSDLMPSQGQSKSTVERHSGRESLRGASKRESSHREDDELNSIVAMVRRF
jgi:hypothetical protein